jgi:hypothetical protein
VTAIEDVRDGCDAIGDLGEVAVRGLDRAMGDSSGQPSAITSL